MNNMEQPINQTLQGENVNEKLQVASNQNSTTEVNQSTESPVSQITDKGSVNLGKFKDAESLLKAYNSLQTEFTKKSQRLSELENSKTEFTREEKINKAIKELEQNHNIAQKFSQDIKQSIKDIESEDYRQIVQEELLKNLEKNYKSATEYMEDEQFLNSYVYNNQTIRDNIIRDYLANLTNATPVRVVSNISSSIPLSPPNNPSTIQEAGKLAKNIIKQV
ncbi:MAG: hypothetical protein IJ358_00490 [Clostridia bacterium]|nr:hypothetical protein [Clostridia bacterium]